MKLYDFKNKYDVMRDEGKYCICHATRFCFLPNESKETFEMKAEDLVRVYNEQIRQMVHDYKQIERDK